MVTDADFHSSTWDADGRRGIYFEWVDAGTRAQGLSPVDEFLRELEYVGWEGEKEGVRSCPVCGRDSGCVLQPSLVDSVYIGAKCRGAFRLGDQS